MKKLQTYARLAAVLLMTTAAILAQMTVANTSPHRQARWFVGPMPMEMANELPTHCVVGGVWLATKAKKLAEHTQIWHVRADVPGYGAGPLGDWAPLEAPFPEFALSPWVTDALEKMRPFVTLRYPTGAVQRITPASITMNIDSAACRTWHGKGSAHGWHLHVWAKTWSHQDAVDLRGFLVWSDPTAPDWEIPNVTIELEFGEPFTLYFAKRCGFEQLANNRYRLYSGRVPHGVAFPFRGVVKATDDVAETVGLTEWRRDLLEAAEGGPMVAAFDWRGYPWLGFGEVPTVAQRSDPLQFRKFLQQPGNLFDARPLANNARTESTGAQAPFGATKDLIALQGDAWRVYELMFSCDDYLLRGRHHREFDGRRMLEPMRPKLDTWSCLIETRAGEDTLGKGAMPNNWSEMRDANGAFLRSISIDDQHRGGSYIKCLYGLTGDEALREDLLDGLAVDEMRAMPARGWMDAPRATGRLMQDWAKMAMLFDGKVRERIRLMSLRDLEDRVKLQPLGAPVSPSQIINDPRVFGRPAWVPWNNALEHLGALEQFRTWQRLGDLETAKRFQVYVTKQARNCIEWGTIAPIYGGHLPLGGVTWNAGNSNQHDATYYEWPRQGGEPIMVFTPGWWPWFSGALGGTFLGERDHVYDRAVQVWQEWAASTQNLNAIEWFAIGADVPSADGPASGFQGFTVIE